LVYGYYDRLSAKNKAIYRASDRVSEIAVPHPARVVPLTRALRQALESEDRRRVQRATRDLTAELLDQLRVPALDVRVLAVRPRGREGELHGLYTAEEGAPARIQVWMRTAQNARVVAFRTYLRTLLHEVAHHLDYRLLKLGDSYHTEGFFRRESSLFRQIVDPGELRPARRTPAPSPRRERPAPADRPAKAAPPEERQTRFDFGSDDDKR
jgi:hypothetical protein